MHIVHLTWEYPPIVYGGLGRHVHALACAQAAAGHRVTVVTQQPPSAQAFEAGPVTVLRVPADGDFPYHLPSLLTWVGHLDHAIGEVASTLDNVDIVHAHDWVVARAGSAAASAHGVPLVATLHATEAGRHQGWLPDPVSQGVHLVEQWLADEADEVIVCSTSMAQEVASAHEVPANRITVIPNGIDADGYQRTDEIPDPWLEGTPRITFVGRIEWEKGVFDAVEAMTAVVAVHPAARLRIVGTGGQVTAVAQAAENLGLQDHVRLTGYVPESVLPAVYSSSDLLIAPSIYEPFGLVALEAAAMQVPLVVGDTGGLAEFVTNDRGLRHQPGDPHALATAILTALGDPAATAGRARNAEQALAEYSWKRIAERTDEVYRRAARRPSPPRALLTGPNPLL